MQAAIAAARVLAIDRVTASIVEALRARGIESMILKGPALARALYDEGELRVYGDTDLLVAPADREEAERVLRDEGFEGPPRTAYAARVEPHALHYVRRDDGANIDLHRTLPL